MDCTHMTIQCVNWVWRLIHLQIGLLAIAGIFGVVGLVLTYFAWTSTSQMLEAERGEIWLAMNPLYSELPWKIHRVTVQAN